MHGVHDAFGDVGKGDAGLLRRNRAGKNARTDQEQTFLAEPARVPTGPALGGVS